MRVAKNRAEIEAQIRISVADLSLNEVAALLMLSSDVRKLLNFTKQADGLSGEALVEFCIANNVAVIKDSGYDPFAGRSEAERLEWSVFTLFLSCDTEAGRGGMDPDHAWTHVEWILQRPFQNVDEWLGDEGVKFRSSWSRHPEVGKQFKTDWRCSGTAGGADRKPTSKRNIRR
jgi:hypothetical protein